MKKALTFALFTAVFAAQAFATYIVVLKDGTKYNAKAKWVVANGKATFKLENGQTIQVNPSDIDPAASERYTKMGLANANVIDLNPNMPEGADQGSKSSLSGIKLRTLPAAGQQTPAPKTPATTPTVASPAAGSSIGVDVLDKFERAYENVGIFEKKVTATGARSIRAELTADTEERVFNAISATSFLMTRITDANIEMVELFMRTTNGGAAGRFQMTRADAIALDQKTISQHDYFVRKVLY
jgi:hypothetical protein